MTVREIIAQASLSIQRRDAETLLLHQLGRERAWLLAHADDPIDASEISGFFDNVSRRAQHWPLQYLTGHQEFFGLDLQVSRDVLIPRPETELLVEAVLAWAGNEAAAGRQPRPLQIADVGTGSGAIALALAGRLPSAVLFALDISPPVRTSVELNAFHFHVEQRVSFAESDLLGALRAQIEAGLRLDVVVSNPPYVPLGDAPSLQPEVRDFEPPLALFAGEDGLAIYRRLLPEAWEALRPGGLLALEFGFGQKVALETLLAGWAKVRFQDDYAGIPRIALAERPPGPDAR